MVISNKKVLSHDKPEKIARITRKHLQTMTIMWENIRNTGDLLCMFKHTKNLCISQLNKIQSGARKKHTLHCHYNHNYPAL